MMTRFLFESSPWLLIPAAGVGFFYAWLLYSKKGPWSAQTAKIMAFLRFVTVSLILFLLLGPLIRQIENFFEKPSLVIAWDDSISMQVGTDSAELARVAMQIATMIPQWENHGYEVQLERISEANSDWGSLVNMDYTGQITDLNRFLSNINANYQGKNLSKVLLVSDGIINKGVSPAYRNYGMEIHTIGLGDTIPKRDIAIHSLRYNKISYSGSRFPLEVSVQQNGFEGRIIDVSVEKKGMLISSQQISFAPDEFFKELTFILESEGEGLQNYRVKIKPLEGEFNLENNVKNAFIEVVDGKQQILIAAATPHPDIKALVSVLEKSENYEVSTYLHGISEWTEKEFDLVIFHQIPSVRVGANEVLSRIPEKTPRLYILGSLSSLPLFNASNGLVQISVMGPQPDRVFPSFNEQFNKFIFEAQSARFFREVPPVSVPFGEYEPFGNAEIVLFQRIGSILTNKPLMLLGTVGEAKAAAILGDGIWLWRMDNLRKEGKEFDEFMSKTIQYLAAREDNRKFRFFPIRNDWNEGESVIFDSEGYNDILERIYNYKVDVVIRNDADSTFLYAYEPTQGSSRYSVSGLPAGIYRYTASTLLQGNSETDRGEFLISQSEIELTNLKADHGLLKSLANTNLGNFYTADKVDELSRMVLDSKATQKIRSFESFMPLTRLFWIFLILVLLASTEWFLRKYHGVY
jgi:hypothetical protein